MLTYHHPSVHDGRGVCWRRPGGAQAKYEPVVRDMNCEDAARYVNMCDRQLVTDNVLRSGPFNYDIVKQARKKTFLYFFVTREAPVARTTLLLRAPPLARLVAVVVIIFFLLRTT